MPISKEWSNHKEYLVLKNIGVLSLSVLGGTIIDRCIPQGRIAVADMCKYLKQAKTRFDWYKDTTGDRAVSGMSGHKAATIIAGEMGKELSDDTGMATISDLQAQLLVGSSN